MLKRIARNFKKLMVFILIVTMVTPSVVLSAEMESLWDTLPEIEPYYIDLTQIPTREISYSITEEQLINLADIDIYDGLDQAAINEILREQENAWLQDPSVQEALGFYALVNSSASYSSLPEDDRHLILRQLGIPEDSFRVANELLLIMERDNFTLARSVDLLVVLASGFFSYDEAKILVQNIPYTIERNTEMMRFEQFTQGFDIPAEVAARRAFADVRYFLTDSTDLQYSFIETAQMAVGYYYVYVWEEYEEYPEWDVPEIEMLPPDIEELPEEEYEHLPEPEADPPTGEAEYIPEFEVYIPEFEALFESIQFAYFEDEQPDAYFPEELYPEPDEFPTEDNDPPTEEDPPQVQQPPAQRPTRPSRPTANRRSGIGRDNAVRTRPWINRSQETPEYLAARAAISDAFTNEHAFNIAHQMLLDNRGVAEIEAAFAIGAALQVEPETFMLPPDMYRAESAMMFAEDDSRDYFAVASAAAFAFEYTIPPLTPTPQPPTPPNAVQDMPPAMAYPFDVQQVMREIGADAEEIEYLVEYGLEVMGLGIAPTSAPTLPTHDDIVNNPFGLHFNANESVNLNTGAAEFRTNVLSLPGRGGFGFNLDLVYNSADADLARMGAVATFHPIFCIGCMWILMLPFCTCVWPPYIVALLDIVEERRSPHGLGAGWKFDLPYIYGSMLYVPGRGSFALNGNHIVDYTLQDMRLFDDASFVSGSRRSTRRLTFHDGTSYFFYTPSESVRSHIIGMRDRFGNTVYFHYTGNFNNQLLLDRVIDSNGNSINFQWQHIGNNTTLTIVGPDNCNYIIRMSRRHVSLHGTHVHRGLFGLDSIQNQVGEVTSFTYDVSPFYFSWSFKTPNTRNYALLLRQVNYPSGAQLRFTYGWRMTNLGQEGSRQSYVVTSRELFSNSRAYQRTTFSYAGDPTAFPQWVVRPPANHVYSATVTQNTGLRTVYTFNNHHLNTIQRTYNAGNVLLSDQRITYNNDRLPANITLTEHSGGFSRTTTHRLYYNWYGQVTTAVSPLAMSSNHARYTTTTTYDNRFGLPTTTTFMSDANTTVRTVNRLSGDGRSIAGTDIYENNVRRSRTDFLHDAHGNVTEIREFPNVNANDFITTQITYNSGTMPSAIRTINVRDANGALLGGNGIVERRFTYDRMWRVLSETDPNGYVTSWQYDRLGRVTRVTHPNGGFETYTYNDQQNTLTHRTVLGATYTYRYDGLGNLLTITDPNGMVILQNIYDNRMRLRETHNAQGITSSQRTTFHYDIFDRVVETRRLNPATGGVVFRELNCVLRYK